MKDTKECPRCKGTNIEKGHQELFPSTFISENSSRFPILNVLLRSREFELYACMDCGYSEWYIQEKYLKGQKASEFTVSPLETEAEAKAEDY